MIAGKRIGELADQQGWTALMLGDLAWNFIMNNSMEGIFLEFLEEFAEEENASTGGE